MNFLSNKYKNMEKTAMSQASELEKFSDTVDLSLGDPDVDTNPRIIQLTFEDIKTGYTHYAKPFGDDELKAEIITTNLVIHVILIKRKFSFLLEPIMQRFFLYLQY